MQALLSTRTLLKVTPVFKIRLLINQTTNGYLFASKLNNLIAVDSKGFIFHSRWGGEVVIRKSAKDELYPRRGEKSMIFKKIATAKGLRFSTLQQIGMKLKNELKCFPSFFIKDIKSRPVHQSELILR